MRTNHSDLTAAITFAELGCGVPVCLQCSSETKLLSITVWIKGGSETDPSGKAGLAHLCEHLLMHPLEESSSRARPMLIKSGALVNGHTDTEWVSISAQAPLDHLELLIDLIAELILDPCASYEGLQKEKIVLAQEYSSKSPSTIEKLARTFHHHAFKIVSGRPPVGNEIGDLDNLELADVRNYYLRNMNAPCMLITMHGVPESQAVVDLLDGSLQNLPKAPLSTPIITDEVQLEEKSERKYRPVQIFKDFKDIVPSRPAGLLVGYGGPSRLSEDYWLALAFEVLMADGFGSCLYQWLRNEDFGVYAVTSMTEAYSAWGSQYFVIQLDSGHVNEAIDYLSENWKLLLHNVDEELLTMSLNKFVSRVLSSLDNPHERMTLMKDLLCKVGRGERVLGGRLESIVFQKAKALSHNDLTAFYNDYANWDLVSLIGQSI